MEGMVETRKGDRCQVKYDRSMTGKSRPDFKAGALLSTVHRSLGCPLFLVPESSLMELGTSERRNLRIAFHAEVVERIISGEFEA